MSELLVSDPSGVSDWLDGTELPTPSEVQNNKIRPLGKEESDERKKARAIVQQIVREREMDLEATLPSSDEHLDKLANRPLLEALICLEDSNKTLKDIISGKDKTTFIEPIEATKQLNANIASIVAIKKQLSPAGREGGSNLTIDISGIFSEATAAARAAVEQEGNYVDAKN